MSKKKPDISDDERDLFRQHMSDMPPEKPPQEQREDAVEPYINPPSFTFGLSDLQEAGPNDIISFFQNGVSDQIKRKMKRGNIRFEAKVDLHGRTIDESTHALARFIEHQKQYKHRWLLIIHGKGSKSPEQRPIIKNLTAKLLRSHPDVLAFHSAVAKHGGTGAVYALLKARR